MSQERVVRTSFTVPRVPKAEAYPTRRDHGSFSSDFRNQLRFWFARYKQRRALARLDDRLLRDIGVTRSQAHEESRKWFWQD